MDIQSMEIYNPQNIQLVFPIYIQPYINGIRYEVFIKSEKVIFQSNKRSVNIDINNEYKKDIYNFLLKLGEESKLEVVISSNFNKVFICDLVSGNIPFQKRYSFLKSFFDKSLYKYLTINKKNIVSNHYELIKYHDKFFKLGFEGLIIILRYNKLKYQCSIEEYGIIYDINEKEVIIQDKYNIKFSCVNNNLGNIKKEMSIGTKCYFRYLNRGSYGYPESPIGFII